MNQIKTSLQKTATSETSKYPKIPSRGQTESRFGHTSHKGSNGVPTGS
jgi:hypothetical protein